MSYWTALWLMGRCDDVLHGDFVLHGDVVRGEQRPEPAVTQPPTVRRDSADALQSLLTAIKQDLKDAAQI